MASEPPPRHHLLDPSSPVFALQWALLALVVTVQGDVRRAAFGAVIAAVGVASRRLTVSPLYWSVAALALVAWSLRELPLLDNTAALVMFWTAAIAVALFTTDWVESLREQGRLVMATVFGLAVLWKLASPDFLSGEFFEWTLLVDPRFEPLARLAGADAAGLGANREMVAAGIAGPLHREGLIGIAAQTLTWGTIAVEGTVGVLWGIGERTGRWRHAALVVFAVTTYIMVPVAGFAVTLMAIAMATVRTRRARLAYAVGASASFVYSLVFHQLVLG